MHRFRNAWTVIALAGLLADVMGTGTAAAQRADDPPAQVARLTGIDGVVTMRPGGQFPVWRPTIDNQPVLAGDALWAEPKAHFLLQIADVEIRAEGGTDLGLLNTDRKDIRVSVAQGSIYVHVPPGHTDPVTIRAASGTMTVTQPGDYALENADQPARLFSVVTGGAAVAGDGYTASLIAGQTATVAGTDPYTASVGPMQPSPALAAWQHGLTASGSAPGLALKQTLYALPGLAALAKAGDWRLNADYDLLWYPHVAADWTPYRGGCWRWVRPWGWNWLATEDWGFVPFHFGRWRHDADGWAWQPPVAPFTYAPALVGIVQPHLDVMGWVPLAPGEAYAPSFDASNEYAQSINGTAKAAPKRTLASLQNHAAATLISRGELNDSGCTDNAPPILPVDQTLPIVAGRAVLQPTMNVFALPKPPLPGPITVETTRRHGGQITHSPSALH